MMAQTTKRRCGFVVLAPGSQHSSEKWQKQKLLQQKMIQKKYLHLQDRTYSGNLTTHNVIGWKESSPNNSSRAPLKYP